MPLDARAFAVALSSLSLTPLLAAEPPHNLLTRMAPNAPLRSEAVRRDAAQAHASQGAVKKVYIACDDHTDYMWTADEATYRAAFLEMIDFYSTLADATATNPPAYQSKFNLDGSYWLRVFEEERSAAEFDALMNRVALGQFTVPLNAIVTLHGGSPAEDVIRTMYYAGHLERRYNLRFPLFITMENQVVPRGLASLAAGSGAKWSWKGICGCVSKVEDAFDREHDIYWWTGPDGQRVLMKWHSMLNGNESLGGYAEARFPAASIDFVTVNAPFNGFLERYPYDVIGVFGKGWDDLKTLTSEFVTVAQSTTNSSRQVIVSNQVDFFTEFEATYGASLPSESLAYGNEWELYLASLAEPSARVKRAIERLRPAESMATIASLYNASLMTPLMPARDEAWERLGLYHDHDWTADGPISKAAYTVYQKANAATIENYTLALHDAAHNALGDLIAEPSDLPVGAVAFAIFNPLSWSRSDVVDLPIAPTGPVHVIDRVSGSELPSQVISLDGEAALRVLVADVPSLGYRVVDVREGAGAFFGPAAEEVVDGGSPEPITVTFAVPTNDRDAMSNATGAGFDVRINGYSPPAEPFDFVSTDSDQQTSAMSFALDLPSGATILSARLTVTSTPQASAGSAGAMRIRSYDITDVPPFVDGQAIDLAELYPSVGAVLWPTAGWALNATVQSPDISALVQQHIERPDYVPGAHMGLVIDEGTLPAGVYYGWRDFHGGPSLAPSITITYLPPDGLNDGTSLTYQTSRHRIELDQRGAITRCIDRSQGDREFAAVVDGRAMNDLGPSTGVVSIENAGPVSITLKAVAPSPVAHTTRVTLYRDGDRIDIDNQIRQGFGSILTWGFGFAIDQPLVRHEEVGAINTARLEGAGGHYAVARARYDWLTLNHFADIRGADDAGVTLSNADCLYMRLGNSSTEILDTLTPSINVLAGGQVDGSGLGLQNQGGDTSFRQRFSLATSAAYDQRAAMRVALGHQNPLVAIPVSGGPSAPLNPTSYSLLTIDDPGMIGWAVKPAEEGIEEGIIIRLWNVADEPTTAAVAAQGFTIASANITSHIETDEAPLLPSANSVELAFASQGMRTIRLRPGAGCSPAADLNCDGSVDGADLATLLGAWATPAADLDGDGTTGGADLAIVLGAWSVAAPG